MTTPEWSTIESPTKVSLILEVWHCLRCEPVCEWVDNPGGWVNEVNFEWVNDRALISILWFNWICFDRSGYLISTINNTRMICLSYSRWYVYIVQNPSSTRGFGTIWGLNVIKSITFEKYNVQKNTNKENINERLLLYILFHLSIDSRWQKTTPLCMRQNSPSPITLNAASKFSELYLKAKG